MIPRILLAFRNYILLSIVVIFLTSCLQQNTDNASSSATEVYEATQSQTSINVGEMTAAPRGTPKATELAIVSPTIGRFDEEEATITTPAKPAPTVSLSTPTPLPEESSPTVDVRLISIGLSGDSANASSEAPTISSRGDIVAFVSNASDLVENDNDDNLSDIFIHEIKSGSMRLISTTNNGSESIYDHGVIYERGGYVNLSSDGSYLVFQSYAQDLIEADSNQLKIFLYRIEQEDLQLLYENVDTYSIWPMISENGKFVVFASPSHQQFAEDAPINQIILLDSELESIRLITQAGDGEPANGWSGYSPPVITDDGRFVAFDSIAMNLSTIDSEDTIDIFLYDGKNETIQLISQNNDGMPANGDSKSPAISADGRYIVFTSTADNLVEGVHNQESNVFLRDTVNEETIMISKGLSGQPANGASYNPDISNDGNLIVFQSEASNLVSHDPNNAQDIFIFDVESNTMLLVSRTIDGKPANNQSVSPAISGDGTTVVYQSLASNVVSYDTNETWDIFAVSVPSLFEEQD